jgi:hypothetical protein
VHMSEYAGAIWIGKTHPEETSEITPIPGAGIQHVGRQNTADYTHNIATQGRRMS